MRTTKYTESVSEQLPEQARQNAKLLRRIDMQQPVLHFITATLPQEMNNTHALSQIRSHVSKESHARRRRALTEKVALYHASSTSAKQQLHARISDGGKEAWSICFPWSLSVNELFLFNFFLEWVIPNGWTKCITEESQQSFQRGMRSVLIPVAMTDMSLFTAVMYVSARRYSLISNNTAEAEKYHKLMIHYLLICLQKIKVIINMESYPTDAAMALVLCMATEAYWEGQVEAFHIHGMAFTKMAEIRRAFPEREKVSPFLLEMAAKSIYDPRYNIVMGPYHTN
ncbi:hypothetical protein ACSS6W_004203 [Trichoderma asperelloides]|nr:hypothetical protein LI328DRAFT_156561 [Trichoderma asperelloides]